MSGGDVARLGLAIDSGQVATASTALDKFQRSANAAAAGADKLASSAKPAAVNATALQKSADTAGKALEKVSTNTGLARHEMINLSRQIQDVGVSLASGQSPFMVLAQQGTQIADIFGSSKTGSVGGAMKQIGSGIASVITPLRLLSVTVAGLAIGGVFAFKSIADSAKRFDDVARSINTTAGALHSLQQAAAFKGIGQDDFLKGAKQFADGLYEAQHNMGQLGEFLRANGQRAGDFQGTLEKVADLIKSAGNDQERLQLLQRAGLPATMEWVRFLSQGKDGIRAAIDESVKFNDSAEGQLVASARKFDEAWAKASTGFSNSIKSALLNALNSLDNFTFSAIEKFKVLSANSFGPGSSKSLAGGSQLSATDASKFYDAVGMKGGGPKPKDNEVIKSDIARMQPPLGLFGQTPTAKQASQPKPEKEDDRDSDHLRRAA